MVQSHLLIFSTILVFASSQFLCPPSCMQNFNSGCGGCNVIRAYSPPLMRMAPAFGPCGGMPCPQMMPIFNNPCNNGGCGGMRQQVAYGIPDPIYTDSGRIIRALFNPPPALPPQRVGQNPMVNTIVQV